MENQHYYSAKPVAESHPQRVSAKARGVELTFATDAGVFAKKGLDFGTRLLIETAQLPEQGLAVDLGCGVGVVAAMLGTVYPRLEWLLLDVNERAVSLAAQNTEHLGTRRRVAQSDGFAAAPEVRADAILLNPPIRAGKAVVYRLFTEAWEHLRPGGALWVVIHKKHGAPSAKAKFEELFGAVELVDRESGYHIFKMVRG